MLVDTYELVHLLCEKLANRHINRDSYFGHYRVNGNSGFLDT